MTSSEPSWRFYLSPQEAWDAMYEDCQRAQTSIEFEQYIIENDAVGQKFMQLFIAKAAEGVKIFVIADMFGSARLFRSPLIRKLRRHGGHFYFYKFITYWDIFRPWRWFPRTHIKTLLIDTEIVYTGGVCLAERMRGWRDTQIRIEGPVVREIREAFDRAELEMRHRRRVRLSRPHDDGHDFTYLQSYPLLSWHIIYDDLMRAMGDAKKYIFISTPFFAPNRRFRRLLNRAARQGVDVRLLLPRRSDVLLADWVALSYAKRFLKAGGRIFYYRASMLHQKTVVIDDRWATVGSTNMDVLSFFRNRESNLVIRNIGAVMDLEKHFMTDIAHSDELTLEEYSKIPLWKVALVYLARLLKSFLQRK